MKNLFLLLLIFATSLPSFADEIEDIYLLNKNTNSACSSTSALSYLNCLRSLTGLVPFQENPLLTQAANNHAYYLNANNQTGHDEYYGYQGFTGAEPNNRVAYVGFKTATSENVSTHSTGNYKDSIDGLMGAIYHRFGFLNTTTNIIGIADNQDDKSIHHAFVYNMANLHLNRLCQQQPFTGYGKYWLACLNNDGKPDNSFKIAGGKFKIANETTAKQNPKIILWPAKNSRDIPPAFYEESPDPLPNYSVSGYPISVEFNAIYFKKPPKIFKFTLTRVKDQKRIKPIIIMNKDNDPNNKFTAYQTAFFPKNRLDWATEYEVYIAYSNNGLKRKSWRFTTQDLKIKPYIIKHSTTISISPNQSFILYSPPENAQDMESSYRTSYDSRLNLNINMIDPHTLKVTVSGKGKASIIFHNKTIRFSL